MAQIQVKRGTAAQLLSMGNLGIGEFGYTTDSRQLYIGTGVSNRFIGNLEIVSLNNTDSPYSATINQALYIDSSSGAVTVTLPSSASVNDIISIIDAAGSFLTNNVTISRNGHNINGVSSNFSLEEDYTYTEVIYINATVGWLVKPGGVGTFSSSGSGVNELEFTSEDVKMDETNTGCDAGTVFDIFDTVNFDPDTDGSVWFNFNLPNGFDVSSDISFDINYALNGSDDSKVVYLNLKAWIVDDGDTPAEASPDIDQNDSITSSTDNTGKLDKLTLTNGKISNTHLNTSTLRVSCKLTRDADNTIDTYTGTFQLVSLRIYQ